MTLKIESVPHVLMKAHVLFPLLDSSAWPLSLPNCLMREWAVCLNHLFTCNLSTMYKEAVQTNAVREIEEESGGSQRSG